jgi:hypothetical protein
MHKLLCLIGDEVQDISQGAAVGFIEFGIAAAGTCDGCKFLVLNIEKFG